MATGKYAGAGEGTSEGQPASDAVESALAFGIVEATKAHRWDIVSQLARQLDARDAARESSLEPRGERALCRALDVASAAGDLEKIDRIVAELRERRQARAGVVRLDMERSRRKD